MGKSILSLSLFCALIVLSVPWKPAFADDKCSLGCHGSPTGATFLANHKYNYAVEGVVSVYLTGADKQETGVKLLGQVSISALGNCAYVLKVQNLVISGPDGKKYSKPAGLDKAVRFTLQDGRVGSDICAEDGDTRRSLNIKRAIISLLQSSTTSRTETDIFGVCPTDVSSSQEGNAVLLHRARDLSRCGHREHGKNDLITAVFNPTAEIKTTQVLQSTLNVESKVVSGVPEKVSASEEYLYKPFSVGENGARAKVNTKLTLTGKTDGADTGNFVQARTIIFENAHGKNEHSNLQAALAAVKDTAKVLTTEASSQSAGSFAQLVRIFRNTNKDDLLKVYAQVKGNNLEKRVFLDAVLRAGTGDSIEVSIQILKSKELTLLQEKLVFLSFGGAKHVSSGALEAAASLVGAPGIPKEVYLGVGALASAYCRGHNCHSGKNKGIVALSSKFASKLNCKAKTKLEEDEVVAVLKGIRNIRHLEDNVIDKLVHCANDNGVKARVRVAALEAFLADPCAAKVKKTGLDIMKNRQLDSEIRIKAFLAIIGCPCGKSANEIKTLLESEPVHQVGRFITTTLRHIRASANPDKLLARQHYGLIRTPNKFNVDDRKYSFYREASYNVDALGIGGSIEETVIYSQDSFLPRSASLNLTAEVFGHSLNVFEVGGRQGNLDRVMEHFLGPKSVLRSKNPQELYDEVISRFTETEKKVEGKVRGRRSVKTDIDNFDKHVKAEAAPFDNELDMDIYVKLFGTDAIFLSLGDDKGFDYNNVLDQILKYIDTGINKAKHFEEEIRAHVLFLDAELAYATSIGLPLKLNLVGAATGRLEVSTNIDIRQILRNPANAKVDVKLVPSSDLEISGLFYVDADSIATGLKVVANLHSSTGGHVIAKVLENGQGFDLQIGLPIDKQEIVTASSDLIYFTTEKGQKEKQIALKTDVDRKEYSGCFDQLAGVVGLTACGEVSVPFSVSGPDAQASLQKFFARYPLTGAAKVKLVLEKNDLRGYHIKGLVRRDQPTRKSFELLFEAEGSQNRKTALSGELVNTAEEKSILLNLESPIKTLHGQVSLLTKSNEYAAVVKAKMDNIEYFARAGFNVQGNDQRKVFTPVMEYQVPGEQGKKSLKIDGQVIKEKHGDTVKYQLQGIKVNLPNKEVVDIHGDIAVQPNGFEGDIKAKKGEHNMLLSGSLKDKDGKIEFQNTLNPNVNFKIVAHSEFQKGLTRNDIDLHYSGDLKSSQNRVTISQLLKHHRTSAEDFGLITKNKLHIYALPILAKFDAEIDPKKVDIEVEGQYLDKKGLFDLEARTAIKKPGDYSVKMVANLDNKGVEAFAKRDIVSDEKSNLENYIVIRNLGKYELSGVILHRTNPNDVNVGAIGHLKVSGGGKNEDIKFDIGLIENGNLYSSHAKVSQSKGELVDFLLKINRGSNPNGQLKLLLKDTIAANGQFKVTDADGKGNGMIIVDFKKAQRKIKGDVKFVVKEPIYNLDMDLFLNFEKDNADKVHLSTNNKRTEKDFESKSKLVYAGKKFELNAHRDGPLDLQGKLVGSVEVILPNERALSFKINREMTLKEHVLNGNVEVVVSDAVKRGGAASSLTYKGKITDASPSKDIGSYEGQVSLKLKDGKNLDNSWSVKNIQEGELMKFAFKSDLSGSLVPKPASLAITSDYTKPEVSSSLNTQEKCRLKATYGTDIGLEVDSNGEFKINEEAKKIQKDILVQIRLPLEKAHDIKLVSNVLYLEPKGKDLEYTVAQSLQVNAELYKLESNGKFGINAGSNKIKVLVPHIDPFSLDTSYKANVEGEKKSGEVEVKTTYGKGKTATISADFSVHGKDSSVSVKAHAPQAEKLKKLDISVTTKNPTTDSFSSIVVVDADGRVYKSESSIVVSKVHPMIDLKYTSPSNSKPSRIYMRGNALSSNQGKVDLKIENVRDLSLDATSEATIQKDNVVLKLNANSEKLGLKDYKVDISSKDAGAGKRLEFHASNGGQNVLSGSTSFISKQEGPKTIIEGSGSVKVKDDQKSANFKYIRTILTEGTEQGIETFTNIAIGERSYVAETRVTNLEYKNSYVYCEEKKQCANAELHSKIVVQKHGGLQHTLNVGLDLRKLGFAPEFGLLASSELSEKRLPQHTLDVHVNKEEKKYHLHAYSHPEPGKFPAGVTVTLPKRVLALEGAISYPNKQMPFPIRGEVSLHLDKNKPQQKTAARFVLDVTGDAKAHIATAELGFSHPKIGKEALLKFRGEVHRPSDNNLKIESTAIASHPSLGAERQAKFLFEGSPVHVKVYLDTPIVQVIDLEASATLKDNLQQADVKVAILQGKSVQARALAKDFQYFEFSTGYTDEAQRRLSITGHIDPEKRVDVSADIELPGEKKNIVHGALFLQDNLVKSDYGISKENFNYFVNALKTDISNLESRIKQLGEKASSEVKSTLSKVEPKLLQLKDAYRQELTQLLDEIANDKTLKEISHALDEVVQFVTNIIKDIAGVVEPIVDQINGLITESCKKIKDLYEKQIEGELKQLYGTIAALVQQASDGLIDVVAHFAAVVTDFFEKHKPELQELTNTIAEIFKDLTRLVVAQLKEFRAAATQVFSDLLQQIKDMPIIAVLKEKFQEVSIPEQVQALTLQVVQNLRPLMPTEESKALIDSIINYLTKKLHNEKMDDSAELRALYEKFAAALTSVVQFVREQLNHMGVPTIINLNPMPLLSFQGQSAPSLGGVPTFSLINQLLRGDLPDPLSIIRAYRPRSLNPLDELPAKLRAVVVNGQHLFTFDGRHLTFPGACRYVLVHDFVDRNFTLVVQLQNGLPKGLLLEDKDGNTIELKDNGQVAVNGAAHGHPAEVADSFSFRTPDGRVGLGTKYGLMAFCTPKLSVCYIEVSGFYHAKLRGLLGDGNNEPFDDFRLPNGKIVTSESEFGNAYKLSSSCAAVKTPEHSAHQHHATLPAACEKVFGSTSSLRAVGLLLDMAPFRQACIHAVTTDDDNGIQQACDLARGYVALAYTGLLPAVLPSVCVRCDDGDKPRELGEMYSIKVPSKQADIVVAVEKTKANEKTYKDMVVPLVGQIVDGLKAKHITDIRVYLVGISHRMPYPFLYDTDNKLKNAKITFEDESRYSHVHPVHTGVEKIDHAEQAFIKAVEDIRVGLGLTNTMAAYSSIFQLPLRPGAVKHTLSVVSEECKSQLFIVELLRALLFGVKISNSAFTHSLITITPDLTIGEGKKASEVVGYDQESVLLLGGAKNNKEMFSLRPTLQIRDDACIDFVELTDGVVFSSSNFASSDAGKQKQFLHTMSAEILQRMLDLKQSQRCVCAYVNPFQARSVCVKELGTDAARRRK